MSERQTPPLLTVRGYGGADLWSTSYPGVRSPHGIASTLAKSRRRFAHCLEPLSRELFSCPPGRPGPGIPPEGRTGEVLSRPAPGPEAAGRGCGPGRGGGSPGRPPGGLPGDFRRPGGGPGSAGAGLTPRFPAARLPPPPPRPGGYRPRLHHCGVCGQEPAPPLSFSLPRGGMFCGACKGQAPGPLLPISPGAWKTPAPGPGPAPGQTLPPPLPPQQRDQSLTIFKAFLRYHLGKSLKSFSFWEKVTRDPG